MNLAKRLRDQREDHDLTQRQIAAYLKVPPQRVSEWEKGFHEPRLEILCKLADLYQISIDELIGRQS